MSASRFLYVATASVNAGSAVLPQFAGLLFLSTAEYGNFSLIYLVYSLGISLSLSLLSEPWHVHVIAGGSEEWNGYGSMGLVVGLVIGSWTGIVACAVGYSVWIALFAGVAIGASVFRGGTRYYLVQQRMLGRAIAADLLFILLLLSGLLMFMRCGLGGITSVYSAWALAALMSATILPRFFRPHFSVAEWFRNHQESIRRLLADSLLMDLGAIFTPLLMAPVMGAYAFGTYRALSTVSAPVRLILNPLRPWLSGLPRSSASAGGKLWLAVVLSGGILSAGAFACLCVIGAWELEIGALASLVVFRLPVALVVWSNFMGHYAYIRCRLSLPGRALLSGRVLQTLAVTVLPLLGLFLLQLSGAIWGICSASILTAIIWTVFEKHFGRLGK